MSVSSSDVQEAIYLFCFTRRSALDALTEPGLDEREGIRHFEYRDVVTVLGAVPLDDFVGPGADERLRDPEWVGPRAWRHEEVVERVMEAAPVFPAPFGTLFAALDSLDDLLAKHYETISSFLDLVSDKEEWAVKGWLERAKLETRLLPARESRVGSRPGGAHYLADRRCRAEGARQARQWLRDTIPEIAEELRQAALDFRARRPLDRHFAGRAQEMVFNWAFLIPSAGAERLCSRAQRISEEHAEAGLALEVTGPWPPYSFCPPLGLPGG